MYRRPINNILECVCTVWLGFLKGAYNKGELFRNGRDFFVGQYNFSLTMSILKTQQHPIML